MPDYSMERHIIHHDVNCRCKRCNPPPTAEEVVEAVVVTAAVLAVGAIINRLFNRD